MKMKMEDVILRAAARHMGRNGGGVRSIKKTAASRKNARKAGRKCKYFYELQSSAILGIKSERICIIPDEVVENLENYWTKTFAVLCDGKRYNARIWAYSADNTNIRVRRV